MIGLIVTADDRLYARLTRRAEAQGHTAARATDVLAGLQYAMVHAVDMVFVDMSLHAADTLLETLHTRDATCSIPLFAIQIGGRLPFALRRLCAGVLEAETL
jgi:DNA-binding response OmpR family regulator